jgi:hypothetical protein
MRGCGRRLGKIIRWEKPGRTGKEVERVHLRDVSGAREDPKVDLARHGEKSRWPKQPPTATEVVGQPGTGHGVKVAIHNAVSVRGRRESEGK